MALLSFRSFTFSLVLRAIGILCSLVVLKFLYRLYQVRTLFRNVANKHGIPMLPHNFIFGHLIIVGTIMANAPIYTSGMTAFLLVAREYPDICKSGIFYIDLWPISVPMVIVLHPEMAAQFTQETSLPKHKMMVREFEPFTGCHDLVNQEGQVWKKWRSIFNPGFSARNILSFVPEMVEESLVFRDWLKDVAISEKVVTLEDQAAKVTIDIIGRVTLDTRLHCQTTSNTLHRTIKNQINWLISDNSPPNMRKQLNPLRPFAMWNNNRIMRNYLLPHIHRGIAEYGKLQGRKTINNLAIKSYLQEVKGSSSSDQVDPAFVEMAIQQLKMFIFAGHDTTASTLCFVYYMLDKYPEILAKVRQEHEAVLGPISQAAATIKSSPHLLNQLPYTSAVIKETLRFYPPIGTIRAGQPNFYLTQPDTGVRYPTEGFMLFNCSVASQHDAAYWPQPDEFLPDRFLAAEGDALHVRRYAYRPFELGPRNCIGQELAQMELRAILAVTVRDLEIQSMYKESDPELLGQKAYHCMPPGEFLAHPSQGMPVRVKIRDVYRA